MRRWHAHPADRPVVPDSAAEDAIAVALAILALLAIVFASSVIPS